MLRYLNERHKNIDFNMKWFDALLYQLYWWQVEVWGKRDVIDDIALFLFQYFIVFLGALHVTLCEYSNDYCNMFNYKTVFLIGCTVSLIFTLAICIYLLRHKRYRKIFTNHEAYDTSWARSVFRIYIISFVFFLSLWWIIPTLRSK